MLCPKCSKNIRWDFCDDLFVYDDGSEVPNTLNDNEGTVTFICECGQHLSDWDMGSGEFSNEPNTWTDADWENENNAYDSCCGCD